MQETVQQNDALAEKIILEERIDKFVQRQRQKQVKLENENRRNNITVTELAKKSKSFSPKIIDDIFDENLTRQVSKEIVEEVRKTLHIMRLKINSLESRKRFYILETMDFFRSGISIGKLIPALLLLKNDDRKKAILEFVIPTFLSINKNVEILVSTTETFLSEDNSSKQGKFVFVRLRPGENNNSAF